jgi:arginyl-tRNA synthetase
MIETKLKQIITQAAGKAFGEAMLSGEKALEPVISPIEAPLGDFTTNIAFVLAKQLGEAPRELAQKLAAAIDDPLITSAEAAGAGYVNITLADEYWVSQLEAVNAEYGRSEAGKGTKIQVEFISANPTGPTTIGNARGGFIGDTLSRVLESQGYDVTREYYFNNAGTQITKLLESVKLSAGIITETEGEVQYKGAYIDELAKQFATELQSKSDDELKELITQAILDTYIKPALAKMKINFDVWFNERDLLTDGTFESVLQQLRDKGLVYEKDGAVWLDSGKLGIDREDRVLIKSNGDPTYLAPDIAYHANIFGVRKFDAAIKVLGADHIDQFPSVQAAVKALFPDNELTMASHQWFRLMKDGKEVKVSKRLGQFVTIEELIDEVGVDVARFLTLSRDEQSHMDFDLDLAREQSQKNPLFYVLYSYVRAQSIARKAAEKGIQAAPSITKLDELERELVKRLSRFPELLASIAEDYAVHRLTFYGRQVSEAFHDYYESVRIIDLPAEQAAAKLYVVERYIAFMKSYCQVLGITPLTKM